MKANILGSILGLVAVSTIAGGIVFVAPKISENMGTAVGNAPEVIVSADRVEDDENLSEDLTTDLLTIEKEEEETVVNKEEPETEEETVVEETAEEEEVKADEKKEAAKTETKTEDVVTETVTETPAETVTETPAPAEETPAPAEEPKVEEVAEEPIEQQPTEFHCPLAPVADDGSDSARMYNEMVASTSVEEYMQKADALANASFDINGNLVDPSMITTEPATDTVTEVTEEIVIEE